MTEGCQFLSRSEIALYNLSYLRQENLSSMVELLISSTRLSISFSVILCVGGSAYNKFCANTILVNR